MNMKQPRSGLAASLSPHAKTKISANPSSIWTTKHSVVVGVASQRQSPAADGGSACPGPTTEACETALGRWHGLGNRHRSFLVVDKWDPSPGQVVWGVL